MQNNSELLCSPPKQRGTSASLLLSFMFSFHPPRARTASLMHDPIARHCGGIQHQPTTRSIKYGGMAFKVMLNAPDTGGGRASQGEREQAMRLSSEKWRRQVRSTWEGKGWEELLGGILHPSDHNTAAEAQEREGWTSDVHRCVFWVCVCVGVRVFRLWIFGWHVTWLQVTFHPD